MGEVLRRAREHQGFSTQQVSDAIHINPGYLEALEEERLDEFPAEVYARGFLKSYASFLGLDPEPLLEEFRALRHPAGAEPIPGRRRHSRPDSSTVPVEIPRRQPDRADSLFPYSGGWTPDRQKWPFNIVWVVLLMVILGVLGYAQRAGYVSRISSHFLHHESSDTAPLAPKVVPPVHKAPAPKPAPPYHGPPLTLALKFVGYAYVSITGDSGKTHSADGLYMPGKHQTWTGRKLMTLYADRGNDVMAVLNGKNLGRLAPRARKVWCWFLAGPNNTAKWGYGKPPSPAGAPAAASHPVP